MSVVDQFLDVDFTQDPNYVHGDTNPGTPGDWGSYASSAPAAEDVLPEYPESDWKELINGIDQRGGAADSYVTRIYNQQNEGSCHVEDTEVLTEHGWTLWSDYNWKDLLGTMNTETGLLEFQTPIQKHTYDYDGQIIYSTNRRVDFGVTPNHRMLVNKWDEKERKLSTNYSFQEAGNLGWYAGLPHSTTGFIGTELKKIAIDGDREYNGDDFISLLSVLASDGYASTPGTQNPRVSFCCFNENRREMIASLAQRTGFSEQPGRPGVWYRYGCEALGSWLRTNLYTNPECGALNKKVPDLIKVANMQQINLFLKYFGDQSHTRTENPQFYSSSKRLIDDLQELHLRVGRRSTVNSRDPRIANIRGREIQGKETFVLSVGKTDKLSLLRKDNIETDTYKGIVYCATVPNGTLVTRRNGTMLISGNCVANACGQSNEIIQGIQFGKDKVVHLSAMSLYKRIGSSAQSGAMVEDGIDEMMSRGILPLDNEENRVRYGNLVMPNTGWRTSYPAEWETAAADFKVTERFVVRTVKGLVSALINGWPVVVGRSGHSICYCRPMYDSRGNLVVKYANSWGDWGDEGFGYDSMGLIRSSAGWCFAVRSLVVPEWRLAT